MSDPLSPILGLPLLAPAQAQKHVTLNEALCHLEALVQARVLRDDLAEPPEGAALGAAYLLPVGAAGAWAGHDDQIAIFDQGGWRYLTPQVGWRVFVQARGEEVIFLDSAWQRQSQRPQHVAQLGVNATADITNRLTVASEAVLLTHGPSGDHRVKINKETSADTASLLFQSGWSGRAEMGLAGSDAFELRTSADGAIWHSALQMEAASGLLIAPQGLQLGGALTGAGVKAASDLAAPLGKVVVVATENGLIDKGRIGAGASVNTAAYCEPGIWRIASAADAATITGLPSGTGVAVLEVLAPTPLSARGAYGSVLQRLSSLPETAGGVVRVWTRCNLGAVAGFGAWTEQLFEVATGTSAAGRYRRLSDGVQICEIDHSRPVAAGLGWITLDHPMAFVADAPISLEICPVVGQLTGSGHEARGRLLTHAKAQVQSLSQSRMAFWVSELAALSPYTEAAALADLGTSGGLAVSLRLTGRWR